jgi:hypothetical protein
MGLTCAKTTPWGCHAPPSLLTCSVEAPAQLQGHVCCCRRCLQVHAALGKEDAFLEYYRDNRRQQLASDLTPPADFAESYPAFIAQVRTVSQRHITRIMHQHCDQQLYI